MQERLEWKESMGKGRMARGGPKGSLASVHRSLPRSDAQQPSLQASTGSLQGILQETQGFYRKSVQFYTMFDRGSFGRWGSVGVVWEDR